MRVAQRAVFEREVDAAGVVVPKHLGAGHVVGSVFVLQALINCEAGAARIGGHAKELLIHRRRVRAAGLHVKHAGGQHQVFVCAGQWGDVVLSWGGQRTAFDALKKTSYLKKNALEARLR